ncbi:hypothetical protein FB451DRAFT_1394135 [Mycena latifolia]|nr:hypothetical protein FB451DRAFT_1394135 [Mycena latifolia]
MDAPETTKLNPGPPSPTPSQSPPAIFSLPNELFIAIAFAGQEPDRIHIHVDFKSEWTLSHVSRRFRDVIIGAPVLWTFVEIDRTHQGSVEIMKLYFARSLGCKIRANLRDIKATKISITPILAVLQDAAVPILQDLEIKIEDNAAGYRPLDLLSLGPPHALTLFKMVGFAPQFPLPQWMASLTHLNISRSDHLLVSNGNIVDLTTQCPALIHLYIDTTYWASRQGRIIIPSLQSLRISVNDSDEAASFLLEIFEVLDTPAVTELIVEHAHGDHICVLLNSACLSNSSFPVLTTLSFVNSRDCGCEVYADICFALQTISPPPLRLFPALSSLTLINECFTAHIVEQILGSVSLETFTVCPTVKALQDVYTALQDGIRSNRQRGQLIPKFRFSRMLFEQLYWDENRVDVELFDPTEALAALVG